MIDNLNTNSNNIHSDENNIRKSVLLEPKSQGVIWAVVAALRTPIYNNGEVQVDLLINEESVMPELITLSKSHNPTEHESIGETMHLNCVEFSPGDVISVQYNELNDPNPYILFVRIVYMELVNNIPEIQEHGKVIDTFEFDFMA